MTYTSPSLTAIAEYGTNLEYSVRFNYGELGEGLECARPIAIRDDKEFGCVDIRVDITCLLRHHCSVEDVLNALGEERLREYLDSKGVTDAKFDSKGVDRLYYSKSIRDPGTYSY